MECIYMTSLFRMPFLFQNFKLFCSGDAESTMIFFEGSKRQNIQNKYKIKYKIHFVIRTNKKFDFNQYILGKAYKKTRQNYY